MNSILPIDVPSGLRLDAAKARAIGESLSERYCFAEPFPHIVLDDFLPADLLRLAIENFPQEALKSDVTFDSGYAGFHKRQILPADCNPIARSMFHFFNSQPFLEFLEGLTSMQGLIPDPYFMGGGFHEIARGGKLGIHADFRINNQLNLSRRMNVIIYLNEEWREEYGGCLELWDRKMTARREAVLPIANRCVIFNTDADSYHGHPDPLQSPDGVFRRSIALYYYTASKAIYDEVPDKSTVYQARPEDSAVDRRQAFDLRLDEHLRQWTPPALLRYVMAVKRRVLPARPGIK